jgi:ATP-dependent protease HslVU (ClpYQ) peptidase subunit
MMTCIVGLVSGGKVYMGGDRGVETGGEKSVLTTSKVFLNTGCLIGASGELRFLQLLQYKFTPPPRPSHSYGLMSYMVSDFADEIRRVLKEVGHEKVESNAERHTGIALVGIEGRLFYLGGDCGVLETQRGYDTIGSGGKVALGSLYTTEHMDYTPEERIRVALGAAAELSTGVSAPFDILNWGEV